ncbi:hypothetical protein ACFS5N_01055 [Mucilaginibacter ximonensis]|uniref:Uncharacterized protein n=1 Tax=Mucilaginibacter ximonensis TaxID=538021 RepID=A0ABW5Y6R5_9SPHI
MSPSYAILARLIYKLIERYVEMINIILNIDNGLYFIKTIYYFYGCSLKREVPRLYDILWHGIY